MKSKRIIIAIAAIGCLATASAWGQGAQVIAHRGYWKSVEQQTQNSRQATAAAFKLGCYGSETDVWLTEDGLLMANHDPSFAGVTLQDATAATCLTLTLSNGERMPTLYDLLTITRQSKSPTRLIIEVKSHRTDERNIHAARATVELVRKMGLQDRVEYIAFSALVCQTIHESDPEAKIAYLNGDLSPAQLKEMGLTGLDYTLRNLRENPTWVKEAHQLGLTVNVWTINKEEELEECNRIGVDYITTNEPELAAAVSARFAKK